MRPDEAFVGRALVAYFGGPSSATASDGEDPPDIYLAAGKTRVGVEVSRLSQFTFEPDGTFGNRATQDSFGMRLIEELNARLGPLLPHDISLLVGVEVPVTNALRFKKRLDAWVTQIATVPVLGDRHQSAIENVKATVSVVPARSTGKRIAGFVANNHSSADILANARLMLENRVRTKSDLCNPLSKPVWLALLNDYWLADATTYALAAQQLSVAHCFERILLVTEDGAVTELTIGSYS